MRIEPDPSRPNDPADEALDRLLAQARWPEPTPDAIERLRGRWRERSVRQRVWLRIGLAVTAAAAVVLLVIGVSLRFAREPDGGLQPMQLSILPDDDGQMELTPAALTRVVWREPTMYERLLATPPRPVVGLRPTPVAAVEPERRLPEPSAASAQPVAPLNIDDFLARVIDPATRNSTLDEFAAMPEPPVASLLAEFSSARSDRRLAAAAAVARVCSPDILERLVEMVQTNENRREALAALMRCHDPLAARYLTAARSDRVIDAQVRSVQVQMRQFF